MQIVHLLQSDRTAVRQIANLLVEGFKQHWPSAWPDIESALEEVQECSGPDKVSLIAIYEDGTLLGWEAAAPQYDDHAWELHPLVLHPDYREVGIGRALVQELEREVCNRGAVTLYLGTDDEDNLTTLAARDLYPNVLERLMDIKNLRGHPYELYHMLGFVVVGAIPDANGLGKPDNLMAKRLTG